MEIEGDDSEKVTEKASPTGEREFQKLKKAMPSARGGSDEAV